MHLPHTHPSLGFPLMPSPASLCLCLSAEHRLRNADDMGGADAFLAVPVRATPSLKRRLLALGTCPFFCRKKLCLDCRAV